MSLQVCWPLKKPKLLRWECFCSGKYFSESYQVLITISLTWKDITKLSHFRCFYNSFSINFRSFDCLLLDIGETWLRMKYTNRIHPPLHSDFSESLPYFTSHFYNLKLAYLPIQELFINFAKKFIMTIEKIEFNSKPRNQSEILISWASGETTSALFNDSYPIQIKDYYAKAIRDLFEKNNDITSFEELYGLFCWWFVRYNLVTPVRVATYYNDERKRIGARIKSIREEKNMQAKQLSQMTGIDAANLSRIEQGKSSAGLDTLSKIANSLGYRIDFVKGTDISIK